MVNDKEKKIFELREQLKEVKSRWELLGMLWLSIKLKKKWWLLPLLFLLAILSIFFNILNNYSILPAIYTFF